LSVAVSPTSTSGPSGTSISATVSASSTATCGLWSVLVEGDSGAASAGDLAPRRVMRDINIPCTRQLNVTGIEVNQAIQSDLNISRPDELRAPGDAGLPERG